MKTPQMPSPEHSQFDAICAPVEDFEPLPTVMTGQLSAERDEEAWERRDESLEDRILAGLVAPY